MAYTVKQLAKISGVSIRTLHFYDEVGLLAPAYHGSNGYRFYEQAQLLRLQQILFYRELGIELRQVKQILGRADFEQLQALESHRDALHAKLLRTSTLLTTIDSTIKHLKGTPMRDEEMFTGFSVGPGSDRFDEAIVIAGQPNYCKVSSKDTHGAMCVFEFVGGTGAFIPRQVPHAWAPAGSAPTRVLDTYQPAGTMEEFFREISTYVAPLLHEALGIDGMQRLFNAHGMEIAGPPLTGRWEVTEDGRIVLLA